MGAKRPGSKQRRQRVADMLRLSADWSDRRIAALVGCSHVTVAGIRRGLSAGGQIDHLNAVVGGDGKRYRRRSHPTAPASPAPPEEAASADNLERLADAGERFGTIYADPPWRYENVVTRGAAEDHYPTMSLAEIRRCP